MYNVKKQYEALLGITPLEQGFDSLRVRIWCIYGNLKKTHLLELTFERKQSRACLYRMLIDGGRNSGYELEEKRISSVIPRSGWSSLFQAVKKYGILSLPSYEEIPDYEIGVDGEIYLVEFATESRYRFYNYLGPAENGKRIKEAASLEKFLMYLESEFGFSRYEVFK